MSDSSMSAIHFYLLTEESILWGRQQADEPFHHIANQYPTCNIFHKSVIAYKYCQDHAPFRKYLRNEDLYVGYMAMNSVANRKEVSIKFVFLGDRKYILQYNYVCPIFIWLECCPDFKLERELENCWRCNHGKRGHLTYQKKWNSD